MALTFQLLGGNMPMMRTNGSARTQTPNGERMKSIMGIASEIAAGIDQRIGRAARDVEVSCDGAVAFALNVMDAESLTAEFFAMLGNGASCVASHDISPSLTIPHATT